jgi:hypothetical protein
MLVHAHTYLSLVKYMLGSALPKPDFCFYAFFCLIIRILLACLKYTKLGASPSFLGGKGVLNYTANSNNKSNRKLKCLQ